jgi:hypothetical protein
LLQSAFVQNKLLFVGQTASLADPIAFKIIFTALRKKSWVVYAKKPFGSPVHVPDYLGDLSSAVPKLPKKSVHQLMLELTGIDINRCPLCQKGTLVLLAKLSVPANEIPIRGGKKTPVWGLTYNSVDWDIWHGTM